MSHSSAMPGIPAKSSRLIDATPVYYGWVIVAASTVAMALTIPAQTAGVSLFIDPMMGELGLSRSVVSLAYTVATVLGGLSLTFVGRWVDRVGPRRAVVAVAVAFALACSAMGFVTGVATLFLGFLALRALGHGALTLVSVHAVNVWFVRRRGRAIGVMGLGLAASMAVFPPLIERMLAVFTWRETFWITGAVLLAVLLPVGLGLFRERPERYGLRPDGDAPGEETREVSLTLAEARRTRAFWMLSVGGACVASLGTGLLFHHFSMMEMNGLGRSAAAAVFVPFGLVSGVATLFGGYLVDRISPRALLAATLLLFSAVVASASFVTTPAGVWTYGATFGVVQGLHGALMGSAYAFYFGRDHIGAIKGFAKTLFVGATAVGPLIYALGLDAFGGYAPIILVTAALTAALGAATAIVQDGGFAGDLLPSRAHTEKTHRKAP